MRMVRGDLSANESRSRSGGFLQIIKTRGPHTASPFLRSESPERLAARSLARRDRISVDPDAALVPAIG
jgi:hypothetical protein